MIARRMCVAALTLAFTACASRPAPSPKISASSSATPAESSAAPPSTTVTPAEAAPPIAEKTEATAPCEGQRHLDTPLAGEIDGRPFVAKSAAWDGVLSDYTTVQLTFGTRADRFAGSPEYQGVSLSMFTSKKTLVFEPGTYTTTYWEKDGDIRAANIDVSMTTSFSVRSTGELTIEAIQAAHGETPPRVRGHLWLCMDGTADFPGPHWVGGTFVADVHLKDTLHKKANGIQVVDGKLTAVRVPER